MNKLITIITYVGAVAIGCMALLTGVDVVGRYVFNKPVHGGFDMVELLMVIIVACGVAVTTAADDHISVDSFFGKLPPSWQHILLVFAGAVSTFIFGILAWQGIMGGMDTLKAGKSTAILKAPITPFQLFLALGFLVSFLYSCFHLYSHVRGLKRGKDNG